MINIKILIIGIVASGKTTLARKLYKESNIKYFEIDSIVYDANNKKRTLEEQQKILNSILSNENWIIEGTLRKNMYNLLSASSQIIYLDIPLSIRKKRILLRFFKQRLKFEKCNYKPTLEMLKMMYKWTYEYEKDKKEFEKILKEYNDKLIILDSVYKVKKYHQNN